MLAFLLRAILRECRIPDGALVAFRGTLHVPGLLSRRQFLAVLQGDTLFPSSFPAWA